MKKDFFDIAFFVESSEINAVLQLFPHKLYDSYKNLLSQAQVDLLIAEQVTTIEIIFRDEVYFMLESKNEDANHLNQLIIKKLESHFEFRKCLYQYEYNKNTTNDLLKSLFLNDFKENKLEQSLMLFLQNLRSKVPFQIANIYLIDQKTRIYPFIGATNLNISACDMACAALAANRQKSFLSNNPAENKIYLACNPDIENLPNNFIYVPLLKTDEVIAVLELKNNLSGDITDKELSIIHIAENLACHFLSEHNAEILINQSEQTSSGLEKYLSANIVTQIRKKEINTKEIVGVEKNVVALFAKINNFSEISEKLPPTTLIDLLNYHYEFMAKVITEHNGTIDKIIGNVIMAVWGHPTNQDNALELALEAAIEMQRTAENQVGLVWKERGINNYGLGIGINKGKAVAGNLGAKQFMDFTVIGDTINTAQRLESKANNGEILIKSEIIILEKDFTLKPNKIIKGVKVKGKDRPFDVSVYTPLTPPPD